jgi:hypothetical protein
MSEGQSPRPTRPCGKHAELASNGSVRITQCPCGAVYLNIIPSGVTMRMSEDTLRAATAAFIAATDKVDEAERPTIN